MAAPHGGPAWGAPPQQPQPSLSQADRERIERNRLAALERRRLAHLSTPSSTPWPPAHQQQSARQQGITPGPAWKPHLQPPAATSQPRLQAQHANQLWAPHHQPPAHAQLQFNTALQLARPFAPFPQGTAAGGATPHQPQSVWVQYQPPPAAVPANLQQYPPQGMYSQQAPSMMPAAPPAPQWQQPQQAQQATSTGWGPPRSSTADAPRGFTFSASGTQVTAPFAAPSAAISWQQYNQQQQGYTPPARPVPQQRAMPPTLKPAPPKPGSMKKPPAPRTKGTPTPKLRGGKYGQGTTFELTNAGPPRKLTQVTLSETMQRYRAAKQGETSDQGEGAAEKEAPTVTKGAPTAEGMAPRHEGLSGREACAAQEESGCEWDGGGDFLDESWLSTDPKSGTAVKTPGGGARGESAAEEMLISAKRAAHQPLPSLSTEDGDAAASSALGGGASTLGWSAVRPARRGGRLTRRHRMQSALSGPASSSAAAAAAAVTAQHAQQRWSWLLHRCDAEGRPPEHPAFDPRSILIPAADFSRLRGFHRQYWSIKRSCMDLVLFVRVGSFYELYDADADVGMRVGLNPMGSTREANMWRCGCSAGALAHWAGRVLALGYNVGRVEEVAGERERDDSSGINLVARRLLAVYTPGTAPVGPLAEVAGGEQPLIALYEGASGLLGACVVDVAAASLSLGQWQEADAARSMLRTLLVQVNPCEVVVVGPRALTLDTKKVLKQHRPLISDGVERPLTVSYLRAFQLHQDPEDPAQLPQLLKQTEAAYFAQRGAAAPYAAAADSLCAMPHATAALQVGIAHLAATGVASHVFPSASITALESFTAAGAAAAGHMLLDSTAVQSLELVEGSLGGAAGSLFSFLSKAACTAAGRRRLRAWLCAPLFRVADIQERLEVVTALMQLPEAAAQFQRALMQAGDCERLLPRVANLLAQVVAAAGGGTGAGGRGDESSESHAGGVVEGDREEGAGCSEAGVSQGRFLPVVQLFEGLGIMLQAVSSLERHLTACRPAGAAQLPHLARALTRGAHVASALSSLQGAFPPDRCAAPGEDLALEAGVCGRYDAAMAAVHAAQAALAALLQEERTRLGAAHGAVQKVKFVGEGQRLLLELPVALCRAVPASYAPPVKETKTLLRYRLPAAVAASCQLADAKAAARAALCSHLALSAHLFLSSYPAFLEFCAAVSALDALAALAEATHPDAAPPGCSFSRPAFAAAATGAGPSSGSTPPATFHLQGLWNPQLLLADTASAHASAITCNDLLLGGPSAPTTLLLTGANTGGKSTLLRSACIAAIMAQVGCYVPCSAAVLSPVDRIFTRVGAHDRIAAGESTFCVEMAETSAILRHASRASLVVLDELGRGTSTHDGYAIAAAVTQWLTVQRGCRTLFATHYHGLTAERALLEAGVQLAHMASTVQEGRGLVPSYRLAPGPAPSGSCGVQVAAAAGVPAVVVARAHEMGAALERGGKGASPGKKAASTGRTALREMQPAACMLGVKRSFPGGGKGGTHVGEAAADGAHGIVAPAEVEGLRQRVLAALEEVQRLRTGARGVGALCMLQAEARRLGA